MHALLQSIGGEWFVFEVIDFAGDAGELIFFQEPGEFCFGAMEANAMAPVSERRERKGWLLGIQFPGMQIDHAGPAALLGFFQGQVNESDGQQSKVPAAGSGQIHASHGESERRDFQYLTAVGAEGEMGDGRGIGDAIAVVANGKYGGIVSVAGIGEYVDRPGGAAGEGKGGGAKAADRLLRDVFQNAAALDQFLFELVRGQAMQHTMGHAVGGDFVALIGDLSHQAGIPFRNPS